MQSDQSAEGKHQGIMRHNRGRQRIESKKIRFKWRVENEECEVKNAERSEDRKLRMENNDRTLSFFFLMLSILASNDFFHIAYSCTSRRIGCFAMQRYSASQRHLLFAAY